uniref:F-box only protein 32-like isoform X2 n=1 Tax=Myxine glutinosa TaxID=7769 RepID=UPI00358F1DF1
MPGMQCLPTTNTSECTKRTCRGQIGQNRATTGYIRLCCAADLREDVIKMPFLGQDWRSPGDTWVKAGDTWKRSNSNINASSYLPTEENKENSTNNLHCEVVTKKRRKDVMNNTIKTQYFHKDKWIYVHKASTRERHGYCTLGEAFSQLDLSTAIHDRRRYAYVVRLLQLIAQSQLPSLSGAAQKNYFNILEKIVDKVLRDKENGRQVRELLTALHSVAFHLVRDVGKSVLVGNINVWAERLESLNRWNMRLADLQIKQQKEEQGPTLTDLPCDMQMEIFRRLPDGLDINNLGQTSTQFLTMSQDHLLWRKLCQYHFTERQFRKRLTLHKDGQLDWQTMYFKLQRCYPQREEYGDTPRFCRHCHVLFWQDTGHPCTANNAEEMCVALSPQAFINLFRF